ncbi:MAG: MarR family transcriptional regulator [Holophagae bacterium]
MPTDGRFDALGDVVETAPGAEFYRFLRYGHILSSLLREFLEASFLDELAPHRLTRPQFCFLKLIAANSELQVGELARCLGVSPAASSKNLDRLEELGLVVRETSPEDRRATLLSASRAGTRLVEEYERLKAARLAPAIDDLGPERTDQLADLLREVCLGLLRRHAVPDAPCMRCAGYYRPNCAVESLQGECALKPRRGVEA